ncbi:hypothetical protein DA075_31715 [Methylobacterium currus]|uniref:Uncharacterized protein n=1 Tax=Methylobacterium currus TaxID=2051553 RepID=A0A2R4WV94_9HYPH|nr:hypothetical protein DA075_31715 [Methylobacterium currus]
MVTLKARSWDGAVRTRRSPTPNAAQAPTQGAFTTASITARMQTAGRPACCGRYVVIAPSAMIQAFGFTH